MVAANSVFASQIRAPKPSGVPRPIVIINAASGSAGDEQRLERLKQAFDESGIDVSISLAHSGKELRKLAEEGLRDGCRPIIAAGGDGTINAIASVMVDTDCPLGIIPLGTFNHFAKDLNIPLDLEAAAMVCLSGREAQIDVGEVNGQIFLNNSSLGLYPSIVRHREKQQQKLGRGKWPAFVWAAILVLKRYPFLNVRLKTEDQTLSRRTPFVFVGNNEYQMEGFSVGERRALDQGKLSLYVTHGTTRLGLLRLAFRVLFGRVREESDFDALSTRELLVETRRPKRMNVATDGEVGVMSTPLSYRIRPGALRVLVPKEF